MAKKSLRESMHSGIWMTATFWPLLMAIFAYLEVEFLRSLPSSASPKLPKFIAQWQNLQMLGLVMFGCMVVLQVTLFMSERKPAK